MSTQNDAKTYVLGIYISLVCDKVVIVNLFCRPPKVILDKSAFAVFEKPSQCSKNECATTLKYINMPVPCYNLPTECPGAEAEGTDPKVDPEDDEPNPKAPESSLTSETATQGSSLSCHDHHRDKAHHHKDHNDKSDPQEEEEG